MKISVLAMLFMYYAGAAFSQGCNDLTLNERFGNQVKSLNEFLERLNGDEYSPAIKTHSENLRLNNLAMLMDFQMPHKDTPDFRGKATKFFHAIEGMTRPLQDNDSLLFAVAECTVKYKEQEKAITLTLQKEIDKQQRSRWALVGVDGLHGEGIIDTCKVRGISPVDHEIHFIELLDAFKYHAQDAMAYRKANVKIDQLSVFLTLIQTGQAKLLSVDGLTYHVLSVPNFIFTINEFARKTENSGWLISSFTEIAENEKYKYIQKLLGK